MRNMRTFLGFGRVLGAHSRDEGQEGGESGTNPRESTWVCSKRGKGKGGKGKDGDTGGEMKRERERIQTILGIPGAYWARHPRGERACRGDFGMEPRESTWVCSKRGRGRGRVERERREAP